MNSYRFQRRELFFIGSFGNKFDGLGTVACDRAGERVTHYGRGVQTAHLMPIIESKPTAFMGLSITTRVVLSMRSLFFGYLSGLVVLESLRILRLWPLGRFAFSFAFHALCFALMTLLGWLLFLLPFVVNENPKRTFRQPFSSALAGGMAGACLLTILLLSLLGRSTFALPDYRPAWAGYAFCAFAIGSVATGLYVISRNRKEPGERIQPGHATGTN
jgi:hypothetical protein